MEDRDTKAAFEQATAPYRREILAHCYRLLGSLQDAEDLHQETLLRAWRAFERFDGRAPRAWLYRIATNACLDVLETRRARALPSQIGSPWDPRADLAAPVLDPVWLDPYPDAWLPDVTPGPEARLGRQESVALAFLAALQLLPPRQRAVLLLRDVLAWSAAEAADALGMTVAAANSALQRARETVEAQRGRPMQSEKVTEAERSLLGRFLRAWEEADIPGIVTLLREDVIFSMPPLPDWYAGPADIAAGLASKLFAGDAKGAIRMLPTRANGQPAFGFYKLDPASGRHEGAGIMVLRLVGGAVAEIHLFSNPLLLARFGLPPALG